MRLIILFLSLLVAYSLSSKSSDDTIMVEIVQGKLKNEENFSKKKFTISGRITDETSGETLIGANIYNIDGGEGTSTNEYGFYSLTLFEGIVTLRYSYIGCEPRLITFTLNENIEQNVKLNSSLKLSELVVYGEHSETGINAVQMGVLDIPQDIIKNAPALFGEADIMKTMQMLPGVQGGIEGSAGIYVRGGGTDENLILLDGVPLYNVNHMFGFFSAFTSESIKKVSLYKGSFPARFGGRLSSVIDVRTNDGDMHNYHGNIGIGLLSSKIQLEGPIVKDRTSFNISARRSYVDLLAKPFMSKDDYFGYFFYDLNAKVNHRFNDRSCMFISLYKGNDKLDMEYKDQSREYASRDNVDLYWGNFLSAVKWNYQITSKLFSNTTLAYTQYKLNIDSKNYERSVSKSFENTYNSKYFSGIEDLMFNLDIDYHPLPNHHIKFGGAYLNHYFQPEVQTSKIKYNEEGMVADTTYTSMSDSHITAHEANVYLEDNLSIGRQRKLNCVSFYFLINLLRLSYQWVMPMFGVLLVKNG